MVGEGEIIGLSGSTEYGIKTVKKEGKLEHDFQFSGSEELSTRMIIRTMQWTWLQREVIGEEMRGEGTKAETQAEGAEETKESLRRGRYSLLEVK